MTAGTERSPAPPRPDSADAIGAWLDRLVHLTRLPPRHAAEIRQELDAHLRERVRDLMLAGHEEPEAIHKSISELGDLALLAQRYREAHRTPKGRLIMHTMLVTAVAAALGISSFALQRSSQPLPSSPAGAAEPTERATTGANAAEGLPTLRYSFGERSVRGFLIAENSDGATLEGVLADLGDGADARVFVYWRPLESSGLSPEQEMRPVPVAGQTISKALAMISDTLGLEEGGGLDYRVENGLMEIATRDFFDRRELELVSYDASSLLDSASALDLSVESQTLIELVTTVIEPGLWQARGGFATIYAAGDHLFVNAPARIHERVSWLLERLARPEPRAADAQASLRLRAEDGRVLAEIESGGSTRRLSADELQIVAGQIQSLDAKGAATSHGLRVVVFPLANTPAAELLPLLSRRLEEAGLEDAVRAVPDQATNSIILHGRPEQLRVAEVLLRELDGPERDPGDGANAAPAGDVQIEGAVVRPGSYQIPPGGQFTLQRLLNSAGGPLPEARRVLVTRPSEAGPRLVHLVNVVCARTDEAFVLEADDRVLVEAR